MLPQEIIRKKRDGGTLSAEEITALIQGLADGRVTDAQAGAFAMAVFFNGMSRDECVALTRAMTASGDVLDWSRAGLDGPVLDKHSTGGVGDTVSLMLAPMIAACGGFVPMISGRGLGHTGGTLDKFDSIPGYQTQPDTALFRKVVREAGCAVIGQTERLAPADKRLYAIRDVTATVESVPLITASILSKKLAAGLHGLTMDVKVGNGAFMSDIGAARELAESIVAVANGAGLKTTALLTDMNQPLARAAGNGLEMLEAADYLTGARRDARLHEVTLALGAEMLVNGGLSAGIFDARVRLETALASGAAAERFSKMVAGLGGPTDFLERAPAYISPAQHVGDCIARETGFVTSIDTRAIGLGVISLGGGRTRPQDAVDHSVGYDRLAPLGARIARGDALGRVHARDEAELAAGIEALRRAYETGPAAPAPHPPVIERIGAP